MTRHRVHPNQSPDAALSPGIGAGTGGATAGTSGGASGGATPSGDANSSPTDFFNRETSWLEFNRRVLNEAVDERTPLLERVGFLAIFNSNLDEFFQKRVGGLKQQVVAGITTRTPDGLTPREQLTLIRKIVLELLETQAACYEKSIRPALAAHGIHLLHWHELTDGERAFAREYFRNNLFPVLTPLAVDPGHPFPFISNLSTSLGVMLRPKESEAGATTSGDAAQHTDETPASNAPGSPGAPAAPAGESDSASDLRFARVKVPKVIARWLRVADSPGARVTNGAPYRFIHVEQVVRHNLEDLFAGMQLVEIEPFRVTRSVGQEIADEEDAKDLLEFIERELRERRFADVIRLEVDNEPSARITPFLMEQLELDETDVYRMPSELDYNDMRVIADLSVPGLKYEPWTPVAPPRLADDEADIFSVIRAGDVMVHHPYESFTGSVERFIRSAARDPKVMAIKLTLYRTSADSPFLPELIRAAEAGKQVVALIELKARFDEERNIHLAQALEKAGVHVVYGIVGLKTHTKTALVVRQEGEAMRAYAHIGTGNYNPKTANLYTDFGIFTCNPEITADLVELFHYLTGHSAKKDFRRLLIAPTNMKRRFVEMIDREIADCVEWRKRGGDPSDPQRPRITAKMNSLEDRGVARRLYEASRAGVRVELIVRGFCCVRPGVPGLSENISVVSVIGRFLEHSRIYRFQNRGTPEYFIGSADWMYRNLNDRVECITPILDAKLQARLQQIIDIMQSDTRQAWDLQPDGKYAQRTPRTGADATPSDIENAKGTHVRLMELHRREAHENQA